jgi:arabinogalactan oligomer/maltooligosaccharide transport system permease protein
MSLRRFALPALLALALVLVTGCGKSTPAPAKSDKATAAAPAAPAPAALPPAGPPKTVTLWHSYRDDERKSLDQLIEHWNKNHPEIQITALAVPFDAIIDKFQVAVPRGNGPDLVIMAHDKIGTWARDGLLQPLGDFGTPERLGRFLPQTVKPLVFEKAIYGLPLAFKSLVLFYNTAMVQQSPKTMAELIQVAKGFTNEAEGKFGFTYDAAGLYYHAAFLHAEGGQVFDETTRKLTIDTPEAQKAIQVVKDLHLVHKILPKGMTGFVITAMFNDGKTPFVLNGPWFISEIDPAVKWAVAVLPELEPGKPLKPFLGSEAILLSKQSKERDAALKILDYLTSDEAALTRLKVGRQMVANVKVYENPEWANDPVVKVFRAQAEQSVPMSNAVEAGVAWSPYDAALRKSVFGDSTPADALAEAAKKIDEALARLSK